MARRSKGIPQRKVSLNEFYEYCRPISGRVRSTPAHKMARFSREPGIRRAIAAALYLNDARDRLFGDHKDSQRAETRLSLLEHPPDSEFWRFRGREPPSKGERSNIRADERKRVIRTARRTMERLSDLGFGSPQVSSIRSVKASYEAIADSMVAMEDHAVYMHGCGACSFKLFDSRLKIEGICFELWATFGLSDTPVPLGTTYRDAVYLNLSAISDSIGQPFEPLISDSIILAGALLERFKEHRRSIIYPGALGWTGTVRLYATYNAIQREMTNTCPATYGSLLLEYVRTIALHEAMHLYSFELLHLKSLQMGEVSPQDETRSERWSNLVPIAYGNALLGTAIAPEYYRKDWGDKETAENSILGGIITAAGIPRTSTQLHMPNLEPLASMEEGFSTIAKEILDADFMETFGRHFDDMVPVQDFERVRRHSFFTPEHRPMLEAVCGIHYGRSTEREDGA